MIRRLRILLILALAIPASGTFVFNNESPALIDDDPLANALYEVGVDPAFGPVPPTFQAAGTGVSAATPTTVAPAWPTHQAGDVGLLIIATTFDGTANLDTANGFAEVANSPVTGASALKLRVYWARATSSSMAAPVVANNNNHVYARILTFRGMVVSGDPWDVTAAASKATGSTSASSPSVTTTLANTLIASIIARENDSAAAAFSVWANAALASADERSDEGTTDGNGGGIGVATGVKVAAGATGATTATVTSSINASLTIALKPIAEDTYVTDAESDAMAWSNFAGTMPTDYVLNTDNGAITLVGAGACGDFDFTTRVSDPYGGTLDLVRNIIVGDRVPDVIGDDEATATAAIQALCSFTVATVESCSEETAGNVLSTDPVMDTLVEPDTEVSLTLSSGVECPSQLRRTRGVTLPGVAIGLFSMPWTRRRRKSWRIAA